MGKSSGNAIAIIIFSTTNFAPWSSSAPS